MAAEPQAVEAGGALNMPQGVLRRYVAFLRGMNVGGHRVKMEQLRALFEGLKFSNVSTFIASGNVIFETASTDATGLEARIEATLERGLGYEVGTFLRTPAELAAVAAFQPFAAEADVPGHTIHVGFLRHAPGEQFADSLSSFRTTFDDFRLRGSELYWLTRGRSSDSAVSWPQLTKVIASPLTMRNVTTIRKLVAKYPPSSSL
jgi:uncharacterized protein (DUF1697 family)